MAIYPRAEMRIDPKGTIVGYPALLVRRALRQLDLHVEWDLGRLEAITGGGRAFVKALATAGLVEPTRKGFWSITRAGKAVSSATAAPRVKRGTAERALGDFLGRVDHVNRRPVFLAKVVEVVLFGSMLKPEVDRVSDVDLAVEIVPKESNPERARAINERRVMELEPLGRSFRGFLDRELFWYWEAFRHLKGGSRVISLANLKAEAEIVLAGPHQILYAEGAWKPDAPPRTAVVHRRRREPADDALF
jgi:predicted nucleotidyltransferase